MPARIVQLQKNAMQSGKAMPASGCWSSNPRRRKRPDPLTGWAGGAETKEQVRLTFPTLEAAQAYAAKNGIHAHVVPASQPTLKIQAYADNFR